jgi:hypothetical protein
MNNTSSKVNENISRNSNGFFSSTHQNNFRNDNNTYSNGSNRTFNSCGRGFAGLIFLFTGLQLLTFCKIV